MKKETKRENKKPAAKIPDAGIAAKPHWISDFAANSAPLEESVHRAILARPLASVAAALGAGVLAHWALKQWGASARGTRAVRKAPRAGFLSRNVSNALNRLQSELDGLSTGTLEDLREGLARLVADELKRHPFETLATATGIGFGLADFDRRHYRAAGVHFVKLAALRALDHPSEGAARSRAQPPTQPGGDLYA